MALQSGTYLGPYEIVSAIGAGGMGEVYRARDPKLGREVAINVLPEAFAGDATRMARQSLHSISVSLLVGIFLTTFFLNRLNAQTTPSTGSFSVTGSMAEARSLHTATLLPSGKVLVAGGGDDNSTAEVYDPATGSFSITGGMEIGRSGHTATLLPNGSVLVAGGGIFAGLASGELYQ